MIYCISDIHGRIDLFEKMLDKINLKKGDTLYVLGDSIDRGGGLEVLIKCKELADKGLLKYIRGNHEYNFVFNVAGGYRKKDVLLSDIAYLDTLEEQRKQITAKSNQISQKANTKDATIFDLLTVGKCLGEMLTNANSVKEIQGSLLKSLKTIPYFTSMDSYKTISDVNNLTNEEFLELLNFLNEAPQKEEITVKGKKYILVHAGDKKNATPYYNLWVRDEFYMDKTDYKNCTVIFGHTTTRDIKIKRYGTMETPYTIWYDDKYHDKICIDCGASYPYGQLACLRLDDMKEFYVANERKMIVPVSYINGKFENLQNIYRVFLEEFQSDLEQVNENMFGGTPQH